MSPSASVTACLTGKGNSTFHVVWGANGGEERGQPLVPLLRLSLPPSSSRQAAGFSAHLPGPQGRAPLPGPLLSPHFTKEEPSINPFSIPVRTAEEPALITPRVSRCLGRDPV